jgi:hypothetical protein
MPTHTFTILQTGFDFGLAWFELTTDSFSLSTGIRAALRFTKDSPTRKLLSNVTFTFTRTAEAGGSGTLTVKCLKRTVAPAWGASQRPSNVNLPMETLYSATATIDDSSPILTITLPMNDTNGMRTYFGGVLGSDSQSTRIVGLTFDWTGPLVTGTPALTADYQRDLTGIVTARAGMSRADECPRCGNEGLRETWQLDGETNTLVCADCYDPPSPPRGPGSRLTEVNG